MKSVDTRRGTRDVTLTPAEAEYRADRRRRARERELAEQAALAHLRELVEQEYAPHHDGWQREMAEELN